MAPNGIVLLHDTAPDSGHGSSEYFVEQIEPQFSGFSFDHDFGLGVVFPKGEQGWDYLLSKEFHRWRESYRFQAVGRRGRLVEADLPVQLEEKVRGMKVQADLIDERDEAISAQADLIDERDEAISAQADLIDERDEAISAQVELIDERDEAISAQADLIDERDEAISAQADLIDERDEAISAQADLIDERAGEPSVLSGRKARWTSCWAHCSGTSTKPGIGLQSWRTRPVSRWKQSATPFLEASSEG